MLQPMSSNVGTTPPLANPSADAISGLYASLDREINDRIGCDIGFELMIGATPCEMDAETVAGFHSRYSVIKAFQEQCLALFNASLHGECDPRIAAMALGDVPEHFGVAYHRDLTAAQRRTPVFFRTDELAPGKLSEVQCCGSGWDLVEMVRRLYVENPDIFGAPKHFESSLASSFARALRDYVGREPVVHHLTENASRPHGMRYFIQRTRDEGIRYLTYDRGVGPRDCNFVRSHDFVSLLHHNFYAERMQRCVRGELYFDLPPLALFDSKLTMTWPFWSLTRSHFGDDVRDLFPHTALITPDGIEMEDGERISVDDFGAGGRTARGYYIKYAGTDVAINWGSRAVFLASTLSGVQLRKLLATIGEDWERGRYWVIQPAIRHKETISGLSREGATFDTDAYAKWGGFYGPDGLMAIWMNHRRFHKVHGSPDTVMSVVH